MAMTFQQAINKARDLWGSSAVLRTVVTHRAGSKEGAEEQLELVRMIGVLGHNELIEHGMGPTWEHAFTDAKKRDIYINSLAKKRTQ